MKISNLKTKAVITVLASSTLIATPFVLNKINYQQENTKTKVLEKKEDKATSPSYKALATTNESKETSSSNMPLLNEVTLSPTSYEKIALQVPTTTENKITSTSTESTSNIEPSSVETKPNTTIEEKNPTPDVKPDTNIEEKPSIETKPNDTVEEKEPTPEVKPDTNIEEKPSTESKPNDTIEEKDPSTEEPKVETDDSKNKLLDGTKEDKMEVTPSENNSKEEKKEEKPKKEEPKNKTLPQFPSISSKVEKDKIQMPKFNQPEDQQEEPKEEPKEKSPSVTTPEKETPSVKDSSENNQEKVESENKKEEPTEDSKKETQEEPNQKQQEDPNQEPNEELQEETQQVTPTVPGKTEEEMKNEVNTALQKSLSSYGAYYSRQTSGRYFESLLIKYNKNQNRRWLQTYNEPQYVEEYLEGLPDRYPQDVDITSSYYYQNRWSRHSENGTWEKQSSLQSTFGIRELAFLENIKSIEKAKMDYIRNTTYEITISKEDANRIMNNLYGASDDLCTDSTPEKCNIFNSDVKATVAINREGYINFFQADWTKDVVTDPSYAIKLRIDVFNYNIEVNRPKELSNVEIEVAPKQEELTPTKKVELARQIENAYKNTRDANSLTYEENNLKMLYNKAENTALMQTATSTTYYKGTAGMYLDYDYVTPSYHQESWTKNNDSTIWTKNVTKHTTFTPKELYFLNHIFTVDKEETTEEGFKKYTVTVLKYDANLAYSYAYNISDMFNDNITFTVTVDNNYIREINSDFGVNLKLYDIENTTVIRPEGIE